MDLALGQAAARNGAAPIKDVTTASFETDVIAASMEAPVIVDFWAPWCGPCKQLAPALEKAVTATRGKVRLAKINIDENPDLAQALRIQSIPTVYAFFKGRPVDAFQGALPESQVKQFVDKLAAQGGGDDGIAAVLEQAQQSLDAGDTENAIALYRAILGEAPETPAAFLGLVRALLAEDNIDEARNVLAQVPKPIAGHADIAAAKAAIDLAEQASHAGPIGPLLDAVARDPVDHQARIDLATALYAAGKHQEAIDHLLDSIKRDRAWNDEEARKQLVKYFEARGPKDPITVAGRRRLSSILFS
ncbi:MAG: co-chaperone YbbN [Rhodospirillales bacterium]|nr:co-chaperone YbbN [Rhodospirillales bacterium]